MGKCVIIGAGACDTQRLRERLAVNDGDASPRTEGWIICLRSD